MLNPFASFYVDRDNSYCLFALVFNIIIIIKDRVIGAKDCNFSEMVTRICTGSPLLFMINTK